MRNLVLTVAVAACAAAGIDAQPLDMCDLKSLSSVAGKVITIRVRIARSFEGSSLATNRCWQKVPAAVLLYPGDPTIPRVNFKFQSVPSLPPIPPTGADELCGTVTGEFVSKRLFHKGYGLGGWAKFGFVLRSVVDVDYCPISHF